ncbi:serine/threonine protein kinase, partial [Streptomyces sp. NPDC059378]
PGAGERAAQGSGNAAPAGRGSGWPVMTPPDLPDLPPRSVPKAPLTDVVPKRTLLIIAVVVALAVIGTVLALTFGGGDDSAGGGAKAGAGQSASVGTKEDTSGGSGKDDDASKSGSQDTKPGSTKGSTDGSASQASSGGSSGSDGGTGTSDDTDAAVASTHNGGQGYSIGLPAGWKYQSSDSAGDRFTGPDGQKLLVAWTTTPKGDPKADWENQERYMTRSQYKKIRIQAVQYRDWNTADWEFTYVDGGTQYRTVDRGFVVGGHLGYALMYTAKASDWDGELRKSTWQTLTETFQPKK